MNKAAGLPLIKIAVAKPATPPPEKAPVTKKKTPIKDTDQYLDEDDECAVPSYTLNGKKLYGIYLRESAAQKA